MAERQRYYRKVIHICAEDSPNVRLALAQKACGLPITNETVVQGVLSYEEYVIRRATWDDVRQRIGLDGRFWEGAEVLMYPPAWLDRAERLHYYLKDRPRIARGIGCDPGEGSANTAIAVVDEFGLIEMISERTPDTNRIVDMLLEVMYRYNVSAERVLLDRGGGGKQHVDRMRAKGINIRSVAFNDKPSIEPQRHMTQFRQKVEARERRYAYFNKRAEMYGELRNLLDPGYNEDLASEQAYRELAQSRERSIDELRGFALPVHQRLRQQLSPIPLKFELERLKLPPKYKKSPDSKEVCLTDIIGHSPDEADALVLAIHAMQTVTQMRSVAGAI